MTTQSSARQRWSFVPTLEALDERIVPANIFTVINTNDSGAGSLRAAITSANNTANQADGPDQIRFNIPGGGVKIINLLSALPDLIANQPVIVDGYTQPGTSANTDANGNNAVILIQLNGTSAGEANGLEVESNGSTIRGLSIVNFRGVVGDGIQLDGDNNTVEGCFLGVTAAGVAGGNEGSGLRVNGGANNLIGGTTPAARNVISANGVGIQLEDATATDNVVRNNFIGTNVAGTAALGNRTRGIFVGFDANGNTVGGRTAGARNVISGNGDLVNFIRAPGIEFDGADSRNNTVEGNAIGTDLTGVLNLRNVGAGVLFDDGAHDNLVGGTAAGAGNTIAFNFDGAVSVRNGSNNAVLGNSIFRNTGGIDLGDDGETDNDPGDGDAGGNNLQNFPILFGAVQGSTRITGTLNSTANTTFRLEFFSTPAASTDEFFQGQGQTFLGSVDVTTDAAGNVDFVADLPPNTPVGDFVSATATDPDGNTSEFSFNVQLAAPGTAFRLVDNLTDSVFDVNSLHVHGTEGNDTIVINPVAGAPNSFKVKLNGASLGTFKGITNRIYVFGHGGNDSITVKGTRPLFAFGGAGDDTLTGTKAADQLRGEAGNDTLTGKKGADLLSGGEDTDTLRETGAGDFLLSDTVLNRAGVLDALDGVERAVLIGDAAGNIINAAAFTGRTFLDGGGAADTLTGGSNVDILNGNGGGDTLTGNAGRDFLLGGGGADRLFGGAGSDLLFSATVDFDLLGTAFASVMAEWERTDIAFAVIVDHLKNGGGLNAGTLDAGTVNNDTAADRLTGDNELDWFFVLQPQDVLLDLGQEEVVN